MYKNSVENIYYCIIKSYYYYSLVEKLQTSSRIKTKESIPIPLNTSHVRASIYSKESQRDNADQFRSIAGKNGAASRRSEFYTSRLLPCSRNCTFAARDIALRACITHSVLRAKRKRKKMDGRFASSSISRLLHYARTRSILIELNCQRSFNPSFVSFRHVSRFSLLSTFLKSKDEILRTYVP